MKVGFIQFKPVFGDIARNLKIIESLMENVDVELIVLPELCNTGYLFTSRHEAEALGEKIPTGKTTMALCRMAHARHIHVVAGLIERSGDKLYNASILVGPDGYISTYRKIHLFFEETLWFDPGDIELTVYDIGACRVGLMICFDWFFPEAARVLSLMGADILCHSSNLIHPFCQDAMVTRCLENRVFAITANRIGTEIRGNKSLSFTGKSQITGPDGTILMRAGEATEEAIVIDVNVERAREKSLNSYNDLFGNRRPQYYRELMNQHHS